MKLNNLKEMKKNYFLMGLAITTLLFSTSCSDLLEEEPLDEISTDYIYSSVDGIDVGVTALYNKLRKNNATGRAGDGFRANAFILIGTDIGQMRTYFTPYDPSKHNATLGFANHKWVTCYQIIDRANAIISAAPALEQNDQLKKRVAEARLIRGETYFDLVRLYENILLDTIPTNADNYEDLVEYVPAAQEDVYKLIDSDFDYAIENLKYKEDFGRYNQAVARHLKGKSAMWQGDWSEAASQFDAIIENGTYHLAGLDKVFGQDLNHEEALAVYPREQSFGEDDDLAGGDDIWYSSFFNNRYYELNSGEMIPSVELGGNSLGWGFPNDYLQSLYDKDNDIRYTTYYYSTKLICNNPEHPNFGNEVIGYEDNFRRYHWSLKKYHDNEKPIGSNGNWKDYLYYRFAETLMLGAEAHWRADNESPTSAKALEYINMIRERAFGNSDHNFTEFTLETYLEESARELAFEKNRWYLLKRLGLLVERQNLHYRFGSNTKNNRPYPMQPHMVNWPIPQTQLDLMGPTFPQNQGY